MSSLFNQSLQPNDYTVSQSLQPYTTWLLTEHCFTVFRHISAQLTALPTNLVLNVSAALEAFPTSLNSLQNLRSFTASGTATRQNFLPVASAYEQ